MNAIFAIQYFLIVLFLFFILLLYFKIAEHCNIIDRPNERSSHMYITLRGGGVIFFIGVGLYYCINGFKYPCFMLGLTLISAISFIDDIKPVSLKIRLVCHFCAMLFMFYQWDLWIYPWWCILIVLVICTGIINVYNFMDGINGITGGYSMMVLLFLIYINKQLAFIDPNFIYIVLLSVLVFNFFNFRVKAKCFAGDIGSISMAFILVFMIGQLILQTKDISYIILLAVYGVDSILTITHRLIRKENIGLPHRKHLYQIMSNELKIPHIITSLFYMGLQSLIMLGFFLCFEHRCIYSIIVLISLCVGYYMFMKKYFYLHTAN
ncbi:UDP-N-acetylmuramyl pentapeptide phosphotransferase/UDP-N-acetylglucosamine-1-phosphate transferase [Parabacteroides sp. PF5-5]|uniref:MraY family glycosyltransferase n=1 Tax=unclassified Parabacteroides TaxID=2649774 RepID=UPI0024755AAB|nr:MULTISPECIES: glycosyltransferase family 4 protein [unclassified Parabacteroides]MDH6316369.1 UDP-N-acetylmuramyl pentapeptide phosphotransferase/UDP-N-acetylglucosamine-1-phosphate transferase [Parabacteroides sp. PF5-13]MDH6327556.1 UDP-N-acetylmuramyl pentapeptide phosphotransferase/UDP-N-acetylglucosamine-1-phosphate transferase [Parabacteroides sp. PH5-41]MDH6335304.1 UDP-N-acetylmuramyl pentapeptide phosphotransferase/UDP-N-acetylglucosamine-1-phosphate transferase [Parabacteroides sp. 